MIISLISWGGFAEKENVPHAGILILMCCFSGLDHCAS